MNASVARFESDSTSVDGQNNNATSPPIASRASTPSTLIPVRAGVGATLLMWRPRRRPWRWLRPGPASDRRELARQSRRRGRRGRLRWRSRPGQACRGPPTRRPRSPQSSAGSLRSDRPEPLGSGPTRLPPAANLLGEPDSELNDSHLDVVEPEPLLHGHLDPPPAFTAFLLALSLSSLIGSPLAPAGLIPPRRSGGAGWS